MPKCKKCGKGLFWDRWDMPDGTKVCNSCYNAYYKSKEESKKIKHTNAGKISIILGILGLVIIFLPRFFPAVMWFFVTNIFVLLVWELIPLSLAISSVVIGRTAKKQGDSYGTVGMILGIIFLIMFAIALTSTLYVYLTW